MCGIWGFSGKKGKSINLAKLQILGLYNEARGTDSCGYYFNGNIDKGINTEAKFSHFIAKNKLTPGDLKTKIFMGHTRKKTCGNSDYVGAHPHVINDNFVQTHNGTIKNIWPLCTKHGISHTSLFVDSIGLAHLIAKLGPKVALEEYQGYAALAFTYLSNPEALYLFHGASREKEGGDLLPERPLFVLFQPEGVYYSSIKESLDAINVGEADDKNGPLVLGHNTVFEVVNGEFTSHKLPIFRDNNNIGILGYGYYNNNTTPMTPTRPALPAAKKVESFPLDESNDNDMIVDEPFPIERSEDRVGGVYFHKGKYYEIREFKDTIHGASDIHGVVLTGEFIINREGMINKTAKTPGMRENTYYFFNGAMLKNKADFDLLKTVEASSTSQDNLKILLSAKSRHPIIQVRHPNSLFGDNLWFHYGSRVRKDAFTPKFSTRRYSIKNGKTTKIESNYQTHRGAGIIEAIQSHLYGI